MIFLVSSGKMIFLENMIQFFRRKIKGDLSLKKRHGNMIYSSNVPTRWSFPKKLHWNMIFFVSWGTMAFLFPENIIFFLRTENERWYFSKNTWKYDVFCMLVKVVFLFPANMKLPFCQKSKDDLFPKNTPKDDISGMTTVMPEMSFFMKKMIFILEKMKLVFSVTFIETFLSVFIYCFPIKNPRKPNL